MKNLSITEQFFSKSMPIDTLGLNDAVKVFLSEQSIAVDCVNTIKSYNDIVNEIVSKLKNIKKSRLIYSGAGTSARIGVQDGVELYPTFGWPQKRVEFIIAGGQKSILKAVENAEDDTKKAQLDIKKYNVNECDIVFGIAASGNTPYTCEILKIAKNLGSLTIAISNNPFGKILNYGTHKIILNTKQEIIAGSTRLKAGTAQKICLNLISTLVMTRLGFVKKGQMINLISTNEKLRKRKKQINKIFNYDEK